MYRRRFVAVTASIASLAGCTGSEDDGTPETTPEGTPTDTPTDTAASTDTVAGTEPPTGTESPTDTATSDVAAEVTVAPDGDFRFDPAEVTVGTGETVRWVWEAGGHNVKPDDIPEDSDWTGTPGSRSETHGSGYEYSHTFEVAGTYEYVCVPHESFGMTGTVFVE